MGQAGVRDEGQAKDPASHERVGGKSVTGGEKVFHHGEPVKGIGPIQFAVVLQVSQGMLEGSAATSGGFGERERSRR